MPINLRYGQKAVERGFISPQRLQQVLSKQRELGEQGKKVSVRMILEKAKLLNTDQLAQVDADLNIKVVKKQTGRLAQAPAPAPSGAQDFAGEAVPEFSGMSGQGIDATVFEPPPADMQDRIRAEREKAKQQAKAKQEADAANFFAQNDASPFGGDPFSAEMAPEPFGEMQPEMAPDEMQPEMQPEMAPEVAGDPFSGDMQPEPMAPAAQMDDGGLAPMADDGMAELDRMDSSPKLTSLQAEFTGFASPDEEELPSLDAGFSEPPAPPARRGPTSGRAFLPPPRPPAHADLAPNAGDFDNFGNDIMSPEALESGAGTRPLGSSPNVDRTMFSPPPPGVVGREKTGAMDRTMFSPKPAGFGAPKAPEPATPSWDEGPAMDAAEVDDPSAATVFSPPPPEMQARSAPPAPPQPPQKKAPGRQGSADFANIDLPVGKRMDDVPTAPATGEDLHPLRRSLTSAQSKSGQYAAPPSDIDAELPMDEPSDMLKLSEKPVMSSAKGSGRGPKADAAASSGKDKFQPPMKRGKEKHAPAEKPATVKRKKEKKETPRVWLFALLFVIVLLAVLIVPIELQEKSKEMNEVRDFYVTRPLYDEVERIYDMAKEQLGLPVPVRKKQMQQQVDPASNAPAANDLPANDAPANDPGDNTPAESAPPG